MELYIIGHGEIEESRVSEVLIDAIDSSVDALAAGQIESAKIEFCKIAYIFYFLEKCWHSMDSNGQEAKDLAKSLCSAIRARTGYLINTDQNFWNYCLLKYRLEAQFWS
jgi:hypothetical protein